MFTLQESIIPAIAFFDVLDFPLTKEEIHRWLWRPSSNFSYEDVVTFLATNYAANQQGGYYFLPGRSELVEIRCERLVHSELKLHRARRAAGLIRRVPFLKAIFVCNSVAMETAQADSDIDFLIIANAGRAWFVRWCSNVILLCAGMRRHGKHITDRICLSFYLDTAHLNLTPLTLSGDDVYLAYWAVQLGPLYDPDNWAGRLLRANPWVQPLLPNAYQVNGFQPLVPSDITSEEIKVPFKKALSSKVGDAVEHFFYWLQRKKMKFSSRGKVRTVSSAVVLEPGVIKLHEQDRREFFRAEWKKRITQLLMVSK